MEKLVKVFFAVLAVVAMFFIFTPLALAGGEAGGGSGSAGGGGGYAGSNYPGISPEQRQALENQLWGRVSNIDVSIWNQQDSYSASCYISGNIGCGAIINSPNPGAYILWTAAWIYDAEINRYYAPFSGNAAIVVKAGENLAGVDLTLQDWQFIKISLPSSVNIGDALLKYRRNGVEYSAQAGGGLDVIETSSGQVLWVAVPLGGSDFSLAVDGKTYDISTYQIFDAVGSGSPLAVVSLDINVGLMKNYINVPAEFSSIQDAVNYAQPGTTIVIQPGVYNEHIYISKDITLLGSPAYPTNVEIRSSAINTIYAELGITVKLVGLIVQNDFPGRKSGERYWSDAAILFDLGVTGTLDHVVVESIGSGNLIAANYSSLKMANVTLAGNYFNNGVVMFNNTTDEDADKFGEEYRNTFVNLLFYFLDKAINLERGSARVTGSVFYMVRDNSDIYFAESNTWGDPEFLGKYIWDRYVPSSLSAVIYWAIKKGDGNYPGALMPMKPHTDGGKG